MKPCVWHVTGVPPRFQTPRYRLAWKVEGCEVCDAKFADIEVPADVMTPEQLAKSLRAPKVDWHKRHAMQALKLEKYPARTTTRAA
jgi:hypothetical protein